MDTVEDILARARQRAIELSLPYAGALLPREAYQLAKEAPGARIIDVRTKAEWDWVGRIPDAALLEWNRYPGGELNGNFLQQLEDLIGKPPAPVMFVCRSGNRSHYAAAAATAAGFPQCFNVLEGFEGDKDASGHRSTKGGWRAAGLPWEQS